MPGVSGSGAWPRPPCSMSADMLSSRNIHILLLGVILGAASGYVYASFRTESRRQAAAGEALDNLTRTAPEAHPEVSDQEVLAMFEEALALSPNDEEILARYATFLFDLRRFADAAGAFQRILDQNPADAEIRTYMATALYAAGERERAMSEFEAALGFDPNQILALHNLALGHLDLNGDREAAAGLLRRIESIDPVYEGLDSLRQRIGGEEN